MEILDAKILEINRLHSLAQASASDAVEYATKAGILLIETKKELKHGQFLLWINKNLSVSVRQAQRYMDVANKKSVSIGSLTGKYDMVSYLGKVFSKPLFFPLLGHKYETVIWTSDTDALWIRLDPFKPLQEHTYLIRCFKFKEDGFDQSGFMDQTIKPVPASLVYATLKSLGLAEPQTTNWNISPSDGFNKPWRSWDENGNTILKCDWEEVE